MTRFGFTVIKQAPTNDHPWVMTSEPDDLQVVYEALHALIPSARMTKREHYSWTQSPQMVSVEFNISSSNAMWLVAKFADLGWEPFSTEGATHYLRKSFD